MPIRTLWGLLLRHLVEHGEVAGDGLLQVGLRILTGGRDTPALRSSPITRNCTISSGDQRRAEPLPCVGCAGLIASCLTQ
jgi:hypothetical protein